MTDAALRDVALTAMSLLDRPRPKAKTLRDPLGRYTVVLVWLPRDEFSSQRRTDIGAAAARLVDGALDGWTAELGEAALVLLRYALRHARHRVIDETGPDPPLQTKTANRRSG